MRRALPLALVLAALLVVPARPAHADLALDGAGHHIVSPRDGGSQWNSQPMVRWPATDGAMVAAGLHHQDVCLVCIIDWD